MAGINPAGRHGDSVLFAGSALMLHGSGLLAAVIAMKFIQPSELGLWSSVMLFETFATVLRLGIVNGLNRELPVFLARGSTSESVKLVNSAEAATLASVATMVPVFFLYAFAAGIDFSNPSVLLSGLVVIMVNSHLSFVLGTYRSGGDFRTLSGLQTVLAVYRIASVYVVVLLGFDGFVIRELSYAVLYLGLAYVRRPIRSKPKWHTGSIRLMMRTGLPVFIGSYILSLAATFPRSILVFNGELHLVGLLSAVLTFAGIGSVLVDSISMYFYPEMSRLSGRGAGGHELWQTFLAALRIGASLIIPVAIVGSFFGGEILRRFVPNFSDAAGDLYLGFILVSFGLYRFGFSLLATMKEWFLMATLVISTLLCSGILPVIAYSVFGTMRSLLVAQCVANAISFVIAVTLSYRATHPGGRHAVTVS